MKEYSIYCRICKKMVGYRVADNLVQSCCEAHSNQTGHNDFEAKTAPKERHRPALPRKSYVRNGEKLPTPQEFRAIDQAARQLSIQQS